jgi:enoyl-CoA hydratase/carnithine racemase
VESEAFVSSSGGLGGRHCISIQINSRATDNALNFELLERLRDLVFKYASSKVYFSVFWRPFKDHLCTGIDLYSMYTALHEGVPLSKIRDYYRTVYEISYFLATLDKPFMPVLMGDVAGIGAGMACSAVFPVATETARVSLPGCRYGSLGAEGGALFKFSRLPGRIGEYLMVSGKTIHSADLVHVGLSHHFVPSDRLNMAEAKLAEAHTPDLPTILNHFDPFTDRPEETRIFSYLDSINRCFEKETIPEIMQALREETVHTEWAKNTLASMEQNSPLAMAITLKATRLGRNIPLLNCLNLEYAVMSRLIQHAEYAEGISAFVEGRKPAWTYATPEQVPKKEVLSFLANLPIRKTLRLDKIDHGKQRVDGASELTRFVSRLGFDNTKSIAIPTEYGGQYAELADILTWAHAELVKPAGLHAYHATINRDEQVLDSIEELSSHEFSETRHTSEG